MFFKRVVAVLAMVLGCAGLIGCLAGAYGVWQVAARLERANDKICDAADRGLMVVQDRIPIVQQQVRESKITTNEVTTTIRDWGAGKVQDRVATKLQIESKAEKLSEQVRTVNLRLEASREAMGDVRRLLEVSQSLGAKVDPTALDAVNERLESLQEPLQQMERAVEGVRKLAGNEPVADRQVQVAKLLARILLMLSEVDQRLENLAAGVAEVRTRVKVGNEKTSQYIVLGSCVFYGLLTWVGTGQAALIWWGLSRFRRCRSTIGPAANSPSG